MYFDGMFDLAMPEVILNQPRIRALVGQSEAASVSQHVRMSGEGQGSGEARRLQKKIDGRAMQRLALLTDE